MSSTEASVAFLIVYITEAHPSDVWQMQSNIKDKSSLPARRTKKNAPSSPAPACANWESEFPAVLDEFGNSTEKCLHRLARPPLSDRRAGKIAYKSKPGPFGFKPDELAGALAKVTVAQASR